MTYNAVAVTVLRPLQRRFSPPKKAREHFRRRLRVRRQCIRSDVLWRVSVGAHQRLGAIGLTEHTQR
jgi:hypothetical protein